MSTPRWWTAARIAGSVAAVGALTGVYATLFLVNPTTVALSYLVLILVLATTWGIVEALAASLAAVLCFNLFFLPPVGTLTIADPQNWVALVAFLLTAVIASQLSGRARQRTLEALSRQADLERLYAFSRSLLLSESRTPQAIAPGIAAAFDLPGVALYDRSSDAISFGGGRELAGIDAKLRHVARQATTRREGDLVVTAIRLGGAPIGSLAFIDPGLSDTVLQSIANLAAIGLEQARGYEAAARAEAARQSGELRATVLDALAHEFKTPLTSMKAATSDLLAGETSLPPQARELLAIVDEEVDRLQALVTDAVQMLRIDAGDFVVHRHRHNLAEFIDTTLRKFSARLNGHGIVTQVPADLNAEVDGDLLGLALRQLLDNAVKSSPASPIQIEASANGSLEIVIHNAGSPIPEGERSRIFDRFYRGTQARHIPGTGMGLAIVQQIAQAHGGTLSLVSTSASGTAIKLSLPREGHTR